MIFRLQSCTDPESHLTKREEVKSYEKAISAPDMGLEPMTLRLKV